MRSSILLLCLMSIFACNGPSIALRGTEGQEVMVGSTRFIVYRQGVSVEAVRTSFEFPATVRRIFPKAAIAIEKVTGCPPHLATMTGDPALIKADLNCGEKLQP